MSNADHKAQTISRLHQPIPSATSACKSHLPHCHPAEDTCTSRNRQTRAPNPGDRTCAQPPPLICRPMATSMVPASAYTRELVHPICYNTDSCAVKQPATLGRHCQCVGFFGYSSLSRWSSSRSKPLYHAAREIQPRRRTERPQELASPSASRTFGSTFAKPLSPAARNVSVPSFPKTKKAGVYSLLNAFASLCSLSMAHGCVI